MTVIYPNSPPSRAGALPLIGGSLALDFANTQSGLGFESHQDHLRQPENLADWLAHTGAISASDGAKLREACAKNPATGARLMDRALALRSAIHDIAAAIGRHGNPPAEALDALARIHAECAAGGSLAFQGGACCWRWDMAHAPLEAALGPIAFAAVQLFSEGDHGRVKECEGHACGWLFYDTSKNNRRRWCEMEVCGNRAKQKRLSARRRAG